MESSIDNDNSYLDSFPPGIRFCPLDDELIMYYLKKKVMNEPLPPNRIMDVQLYKFSPAQLEVMYKKRREKEMFFFTQRDRKHQKGSLPNRVTGDSSGFWKATSGDKEVKFNGEIIGFKKTLAFYKRTSNSTEKTNWIMHEFRAEDNPPPSKKHGIDMKLDWVLCRIYHRGSKSKRADQASEEDQYHGDDQSVDQPIQLNPNINELVVISREYNNLSMEMAKPPSILPQEGQSSAEISQSGNPMQNNAIATNTQYANPSHDNTLANDNVAANFTQHADPSQNNSLAPNAFVSAVQFSSDIPYNYANASSLDNMHHQLPLQSGFLETAQPSNSMIANYGNASSLDNMHHQLPLQSGFLETAQPSNSMIAMDAELQAFAVITESLNVLPPLPQSLNVLPPLPQASVYPFKSSYARNDPLWMPTLPKFQNDF